MRRRVDQAIGFYWGEGIGDDVPALAWFLLSALVPLALGLTAVASLALGDYARAQAVAERAAHVLPSGVSDQVVQLILRTRRDSPLLIAFSIVLMVWTSAGAVGVIERSISRQLGRERFGSLLLKLRHLALAGGVTVLIVLMVLAASRATDLQHRLGFDGTGAQVVLVVGSLAATAFVCATLYRFGPRDGMRWSAAAIGAAPAAVILLVTPTLAAIYLARSAGTTPVHVFLVLAGVLTTCFLAAVGLLVGAGVAVRVERARGAGSGPVEAAARPTS